MEGLSGGTIATVIAVSESTVEKDLSFARAWLKRALDRDL
jgi:DNA-directed RNA polymerase specialized sigma24 family protein